MWKSIRTQSNLIQAETGKAYLIKIPKQDWMFWHPAKLVRFEGKSDYLFIFSYTDEFKFKLFIKNKKCETIREKELSPSEIEALFE